MSAHSTSATQRTHALQRVIAALRARYGPRIIRTGGEIRDLEPIDELTLSTGSFALDLLTGGLPPGTLTEYAGLDGAGTGTLALAALAACQRAGGLALLVDADGAVDPEALVAAGVDLEGLVLACPATATEAWAVLQALCRSGALHLLVLASLPGLVALPDPLGRATSLERGVLRLTTALRGRETALLLTNRPLAVDPLLAWRVAGVVVPETADLTWPTMGGTAVAQGAALRIALDREGPRYGVDGTIVALRARAQVVKLHGLPRTLALPLEIEPGGPRRAAEVVTLALMTGCLRATPLGLLTADDVLLGRTPARTATTLESDPPALASLERQVRAAWSRTTPWPPVVPSFAAASVSGVAR